MAFLFLLFDKNYTNSHIKNVVIPCEVNCSNELERFAYYFRYFSQAPVDFCSTINLVLLFSSGVFTNKSTERIELILNASN